MTRPGLEIALRVAESLGADLYAPRRLAGTAPPPIPFDRLKECLRETWGRYRGHVLVAATGLVVREIAPLLKDKKSDPAVVVLGQDGRHAISLLSGHLGGANELARTVAVITGGVPIINTATDVAGVPALETIARDLGLTILDFDRLPAVSRALAEGERVPLYDPYGLLAEALRPWEGLFPPNVDPAGGPSVYADFRLPAPPGALVLAPRALALGVGCHRGIAPEDLRDFVLGVMGEEGLAPEAVAVVATVDARRDEPAMKALAGALGRPLVYFSKDRLAASPTPNPSETVLRRIGVPSVCEAAAMLAARAESLLLTKTKGKGATMALSTMASIS
jgi:cobalt-precorrin 5A hydrolase